MKAGGKGLLQKGHMIGSSPIPGTSAGCFGGSRRFIGCSSGKSAPTRTFIPISDIRRPTRESRGGMEGTANSNGLGVYEEEGVIPDGREDEAGLAETIDEEGVGEGPRCGIAIPKGMSAILSNDF